MDRILFDYTTLKDHTKRAQYKQDGVGWRLLFQMLFGIEQFIPDADVKIVYVKRILRSERDTEWNINQIEVILFTDTKIAVVKVVENDEKWQMDIKNKSDISRISVISKITDSRNRTDYEAVIEFQDSYRIKLSSSQDTNEYWTEEYSQRICEIVNDLK